MTEWKLDSLESFCALNLKCKDKETNVNSGCKARAKCHICNLIVSTQTTFKYILLNEVLVQRLLCFAWMMVGKIKKNCARQLDRWNFTGGASVLSNMNDIFTLKKEQRTELKVFLTGKEAFSFLPTGFGKSLSDGFALNVFQRVCPIIFRVLLFWMGLPIPNVFNGLFTRWIRWIRFRQRSN